MTDLNQGLNVAIVGLEFGAEFVPIYLHHPNVRSVAICDTYPEQLAKIGNRFGVERRFGSLDEVLGADGIDAVHLITPVTMHAEQTLKVLNAGKHCACTIPAALTIADLRAIVAAERASGKNYMMMETAVYTREFLFVKDLYDRGEFGRLAFLRGAHLQDMEGWPDYWKGFPPLNHITHAIGPALALTGKRTIKVHCFGSGRLRPEFQEPYGNPFPVETAIFRLEDSDVAVEVTRNMFEMARPYTESFCVYGDRLGFEWPQLEEEDPFLFTMGELSGRHRPIKAERFQAPDRADLLPEPIRRFTQKGVYDDVNTHLSFTQGGGHGGSHPHLVHEFVSSIVEGRPSKIDAVTAADWTAAGLCAHESALQDGAEVTVPDFRS